MKPLLTIVFVCLFVCAARSQEVVAASDSLLLSEPSVAFWAKNFKPSPKKATWYAVFCPGLGQVYNRKYWKLPVLYGGFMGLAYAISWNNRYYSDYKRAYIEMYRCINGEDYDRAHLEGMLPNGQTLETVDKSWMLSAFGQKKDYYRRYRDMSYAGIIGLYALSVIDAFVDAQLFDFDISPDLSMRVEPITDFQTASLGARVQFHF